MSKLTTLQVLRGLAAVTVVVDHAILRQAEWSAISPVVLRAAEYSGALAVAAFFAISGFIMVHTSIGEYGRPGAVGRFILKRFWRIVPLYWIATSLEIILRYRGGSETTIERAFASYFFIPFPVEAGDYMRPLLGVGWTLNYEIFFYLLFAVSLVLPLRSGLPLLFGALFSIIAAGAVFVTPLTDASQPHTIIGFWTDPVLFVFAAGMVIGVIHKSVRLPVIPGALAVVLALLAQNILAFTLFVDAMPAPFSWWVATWALCALVIGICVSARENTKPSRPVENGVWLGDISYALYLFHFFSIVAAEKIWWLVFGKVDIAGSFVLFATLASIAGAGVIHVFVEVPLLNLARRRPHASTVGETATPTNKGLGAIRIRMADLLRTFFVPALPPILRPTLRK
ncbi:acyltransferase [Fulvimarina sp. MAC3]|uniref:acyltransferase family protein n=1 Tax=Fulvimarina sp. MAC3 TaxID=3148887 RepID=UPI0031FD37CF